MSNRENIIYEYQEYVNATSLTMLFFSQHIYIIRLLTCTYNLLGLINGAVGTHTNVRKNY